MESSEHACGRLKSRSGMGGSHSTTVRHYMGSACPSTWLHTPCIQWHIQPFRWTTAVQCRTLPCFARLCTRVHASAVPACPRGRLQSIVAPYMASTLLLMWLLVCRGVVRRGPRVLPLRRVADRRRVLRRAGWQARMCGLGLEMLDRGGSWRGLLAWRLHGGRRVRRRTCTPVVRNVPGRESTHTDRGLRL